MNRPEISDTAREGSFALVTLGCKANQYDSAALAASLSGCGMIPGGRETAGLLIVNTCMVTGPTEAQCRQEIRKLKRINPEAVMVVTGCMSRGAPAALEDIPEVDLILDMQDRGRLPSILGFDHSAVWADWPEDPAVAQEGKDRGLLKVQDGCDCSCSYCIVPKVRGPGRSLPPDRVLGSLRAQLENGVSEVVLTGIHLGFYGRDLSPRRSLEGLVEAFLNSGTPGRVRLSSLEPLEVTERLLALMSGSGARICRHLHIPLQSGCDRILGLMNRQYTRVDFADCVDRARKAVPGLGIGCDVICGYPGETEKDFLETEEIISDLKIPFLHVFPYSPRPGTEAARLKNDVPHPVKKERAARLREIAGSSRQAYLESFVGSILEVVPERGSRDDNGCNALADNYIRVKLAAGGWTPGKLVDVLATGSDGRVLNCRTVGSAARTPDQGEPS